MKYLALFLALAACAFGQVIPPGVGVYSLTSSGSGSGTPGGSNTQLQFNNSGAFGGIANLTYTSSSNLLTFATAIAQPFPPMSGTTVNIQNSGERYAATGNVTIDVPAALALGASGEIYSLDVTADSSNRVISFTSCYSINAGANITSVTVPAGGELVLRFAKLNSGVVLLGGDPPPTLPVANGGTGATTLNAHYVLVGAGTSAIVPVTPGTSGWVLTSNGASADPSFQAAGGGSRVVSAQTSNTDTITAAGAFATTYTLGANQAVGTLIHIIALGRMTTTATASPLSNFSIKFGSTTILANPGSSMQAIDTGDTNFSWRVEGWVTVVSTGSSGSVMANGSENVGPQAGSNWQYSYGMNNAAAVTINTTTTQSISINQTSTLVAGQSFTLQQLIVEIN